MGMKKHKPKFSDGHVKVKSPECVQIYDPNDLSVVLQHFPNVGAAMADIRKSSHTGIKCAVRYRTIYLGYRWFMLSSFDDVDPSLARDIQPTIITSAKDHGDNPVAMMSLDLGTIIRVFFMQRDVTIFANHAQSAVSYAIKYRTPMISFRWVYLHNVDENIRTAWLTEHGQPTRLDVERKQRTIGYKQTDEHKANLRKSKAESMARKRAHCTT
jgi:hypothetical protein